MKKDYINRINNIMYKKGMKTYDNADFTVNAENDYKIMVNKNIFAKNSDTFNEFVKHNPMVDEIDFSNIYKLSDLIMLFDILHNEIPCMVSKRTFDKLHDLIYNLEMKELADIFSNTLLECEPSLDLFRFASKFNLDREKYIIANQILSNISSLSEDILKKYDKLSKEELVYLITKYHEFIVLNDDGVCSNASGNYMHDELFDIRNFFANDSEEEIIKEKFDYEKFFEKYDEYKEPNNIIDFGNGNYITLS